ncbi:MAG: DUF4410 domain-containing protein [Pirellulales bacterium]
MSRTFPHSAVAAIIAVALAPGSTVAQPGFGPTTAVAAPTATAWPAQPPARIYVIPFAMDPALQAQLATEAEGVIPQGPVRKMLASRPRVVDAVTGHDRSLPAGTSVAKLVADDLARAGLPAVYWDRPEPPPADGWRLAGQVVRLDEGSAAARNAIGFGVGNTHIGIDVALADPATAGGQPFFILDTSDRGRMMPGTVPIAAAAGFNPYVVVGKLAASGSGISDITQQQRLADGIVAAVTDALAQHPPQPVR